MPLPQKNRVTIIPLIILFLAALLLVPFARQLAKDKIELANNSIIEKFVLLLNSKKYILVFTFSRLMLYRNVRHLMVSQED